jgi:hypothetical protein
VISGRLRGIWAPALLAAAATAAAQVPASSPARADLLRDLAGRLAAVVGTTEGASLSTVVAGAARDLLQGPIDADLAGLLRARGVRLAIASDGARPEEERAIRVTCADSATQIVCTGEVAGAGGRSLVVASRPRTSFDAPSSPVLFVLVARPLFAQADPVFDVARLDDRRIAVLDARGVTVYETTDTAWRRESTQQVTQGVPGRDPRGRLRVDGGTLDVFLDGAVCHGTATPLSVSCEPVREPWPLGVENGGLVEGRNYFATARGLCFFSAAPLEPPGDARWALAGTDGRLHLVGQAMQELFAGDGLGDAVVSLAARCAAGGRLLVASLGAGESSDALRAFDVTGGRIAPVSGSLALPGQLTALWPSEDGATAVVHNRDTQRHEVLHVTLDCVR